MKIDFLIRLCDVRAPQWIRSSCIWSCSTEGRKKALTDFNVCKSRLVVYVFIGLLISPKKKKKEKRGKVSTRIMEVIN